jgi:hypothetical protein
MVANAGMPVQVSSHSLRIGGATAAMEGGLTKEQIMTVSGWRSEAMELYLRTHEVVVAQGASSRMGFCPSLVHTQCCSSTSVWRA